MAEVTGTRAARYTGVRSLTTVRAVRPSPGPAARQRSPLLSRIAGIFACVLLFGGSSGCAQVRDWFDLPAQQVEGAVGLAAPASPTVDTSTPGRIVAPVAVKLAAAAVHGKPPAARESVLDVLGMLRTHVSVGEGRELAGRLSRNDLASIGSKPGDPVLASVVPIALRRRMAGVVTGVHYQGGRALVRLSHGGAERALWFFLQDGLWRLDVSAPRRVPQLDPGPVDPLNKPLTLHEALAGIHGTGPLVAAIDSSKGIIRCRLRDALVPRSVAHFVGLARGLRASLNTQATPPRWQRKRVYDGTRFHRIIRGMAIIGGSPVGSRDGGAGFAIADELTTDLRHDRPGMLGLANRGPQTSSAQFYITLRAAPELDDRYTILGVCRDLERIDAIGAAAQDAVGIRSVSIQRGF